MTHPTPTCETCRWWLFISEYKEDNGASFGECRRGFRSVRNEELPVTSPLSTYWPLHFQDDYCGEHSPRIPLPMTPPLFDPVLDKEIWNVSDKFHVSLRLSNALEAVGIRTIRQVISKSHREIESVRNLGKVSMADLQKMLADLDVAWPENGTKGDAQ